MSYYLYIMRCCDFIKVGIAMDVNRRLAAINSATPYAVTVIDKFEFPDRTAAGVAERFCHQELKDRGLHAKLEWFLRTEESLKVVNSSVETLKGKDFKKMRESLCNLKRQVKDRKGLRLVDACDHLDALGFKEEARIVRLSNSHRGACSYLVSEAGINALAAYVSERS